MRTIIIAFGVFLVSSVPSYAQFEACGSGGRNHYLWPYQNTKAVEQVVETTRTWSVCPIVLQTEAWVEQLPDNARTVTGAWSAVLSRIVPVSDYGKWTGRSRHWAIVAGLHWIDMGELRAEADVNPQIAEAPYCTNPLPDWYCADGGGQVDPTGCQCIYNTPILASLTGGRLRMSSLDDGVSFDLDSDGQMETVSWPLHGSWLALDRNGNGAIDNGTELFGNYTPVLSDGDVNVNADNGFEALKFFEGGSFKGVPDDSIDAKDPVFQSLVWWTDENRNGISEPEELLPVAESGLQSISLKYNTTDRVDRYGNKFGWRSQSFWQVEKNGQYRIVPRVIYDVSVMRR